MILAVVPILVGPLQVLLALLPQWAFSRESDAATGYDELVVRARG